MPKSDVVARAREIRENQGFKSVIPGMDGKVRDTNRYVKDPLPTEGQKITRVTFGRFDLQAVGIVLYLEGINKYGDSLLKGEEICCIGSIC